MDAEYSSLILLGITVIAVFFTLWSYERVTHRQRQAMMEYERALNRYDRANAKYKEAMAEYDAALHARLNAVDDGRSKTIVAYGYPNADQRAYDQMDDRQGLMNTGRHTNAEQ